MNVCFIFEDWSDLTPEMNSSLRIIRELLVRDYRVGIISPSNLTIRNNVAHGFFRMIQRIEKIPENFTNLHKKVKFNEELLPINGFDVVFIRKDPPLDSSMLNFLDSVKDEILIVNSVEGIRKANNKLYTTTFNDPENNFIPVTHVSKNKDYLRRMIDESPSDKMILKPLNASGGSGVIVLEKQAPQNINSLLDFYIGGSGVKNYVVLQEYIPGAENGDVRVLMLNGVAIGAYRRVPSGDDLRGNIHAGATPQKHDLTPAERGICKKIGPQLVADGLYFVGVDLVSERLLEVNVLNPGGITNINRLNRVKLEKKIVDFIEEQVHAREEQTMEREAAIRRKHASRQQVRGE